MRNKHISKSCQEAYSMGQKAFQVGRLKSPYSGSSLLHKEFMRGFNVAYVHQQIRISNSAHS